MICYSDGTFYYLLKLMFSTKKFGGIASLNINKDFYYARMGYRKYSELVANRNNNSMTYLGVLRWINVLASLLILLGMNKITPSMYKMVMYLIDNSILKVEDNSKYKA